MSTQTSPSVLVACDDPALLDEVIRYLDEIPHWRLVSPAQSFRELLQLLDIHQPDFVLISESLAIELAAVRGVESFSAPTVVFSRGASTDGLKAALRLGARDFVAWPEDRLGLRKTVEQQRIAKAPRRPEASGALNAVWAPKGGSGASVIAAHLAATLAQLGTECLLADLDLDHADQAAILGAEEEPRSLLDLLRVADEISPSMIRSVAWSHPDGFGALLSPGGSGPLAEVKAGDVRKVLVAAREVADHVVADLPSGVSELLMAILEDASSAFIVLTPDLLSLRRARAALQILRQHGLEETSWIGVLNQAGGADVSEKDVSSVLGLRTTIRVKADLQIYRAANRGQLSETGKRLLGPAAHKLMEMAHSRAPSPADETRVGPVASVRVPRLAAVGSPSQADSAVRQPRPPFKW